MPGIPIGEGGGPAVLEDPTGGRARWLRRAGRVVFVLFLGWLVTIVLGGLGLMPVPGIPLARVLQPAQGLPALTKLPQPRQPSTSDLRPAVTAAVFAANTASAAHGVSRAAHANAQAAKRVAGVGTSHGKSASAPGKTKTTSTVTKAPGNRAAAPGQTKTTPSASASQGKSATAPGQTKTTTAPSVHGKSTTAPGKTKTSVTTTTSSVGQSKKP
jgi:hypothetical protein